MCCMWGGVFPGFPMRPHENGVRVRGNRGNVDISEDNKRNTVTIRMSPQGLIGAAPSAPVPEDTWASGPALPRAHAVPWLHLPGPMVGPLQG